MMNKYQAQQSFWSSFGWAAYNRFTVPDDALETNGGKYITYEAASDSYDNDLLLSADLWQRSTSWTAIHAKAEEIAQFIETQFPPAIPIDGGFMKIRKGTPFAQDMADDEPDIRRVHLNVFVEFLTAF